MLKVFVAGLITLVATSVFYGGAFALYVCLGVAFGVAGSVVVDMITTPNVAVPVRRPEGQRDQGRDRDREK